MDPAGQPVVAPQQLPAADAQRCGAEGAGGRAPEVIREAARADVAHVAGRVQVVKQLSPRAGELCGPAYNNVDEGRAVVRTSSRLSSISIPDKHGF